jgi:hypothetical protein
MKKIITLFAVTGMFILQGCTVTTEADSFDNDTIAEVIETAPVDFTPNNFSFRYNFRRSIVTSAVVLVYRLTGTVNGRDLWEFLPETYYFADGTRDFSYNFDFTNNDVQIYLQGNDLISVPAEYRLNQIFRIVIVPANLVNGIDKNSYPALMSAFNIKENQIQTIIPN